MLIELFEFIFLANKCAWKKLVRDKLKRKKPVKVALKQIFRKGLTLFSLSARPSFLYTKRATGAQKVFLFLIFPFGIDAEVKGQRKNVFSEQFMPLYPSLYGWVIRD